MRKFLFLLNLILIASFLFISIGGAKEEAKLLGCVIRVNSEIIYPNEFNIINVFEDRSLFIQLRVEGDVKDLFLIILDYKIPLNYNKNSGFYEAKLDFKNFKDLKREKRIPLYFQLNSSKEKLFDLQIRKPGFIYDKKSRERIKNGIATLFKFDKESDSWILWDGSSFGEKNPQDIAKGYGFLIPKGRYYLEIKAKGYEPWRQEFNIGRQTFINSSVELSPFSISSFIFSLYKNRLKGFVFLFIFLFSFYFFYQFFKPHKRKQGYTFYRRKLDFILKFVFLGILILISLFYLPGFLNLEKPPQWISWAEEEEEKIFKFKLPDLSGKIYKTEDFKGKEFIVVFLPSWHPLAFDQLLIFDSLPEDLKEKIILIAIEKKEMVEDFLTHSEISLNQLILLDEKGNLIKEYKINIFPFAFFIEKSGRIKSSYKGILTEEIIKERLEG